MECKYFKIKYKLQRILHTAELYIIPHIPFWAAADSQVLYPPVSLSILQEIPTSLWQILEAEGLRPMPRAITRIAPV